MANVFSRKKVEVKENNHHENKVVSVKNCEWLDDPLTVESENASNMSSCEQPQVETDTILREEQNGDVLLEEEGNKVSVSEGVKPEPSQEENGFHGDSTRPMFEKTLKLNPSEDGEYSQASRELRTFAPGCHGLEKQEEQSNNDVITKNVEERDDSVKSSRYYSQEIPADSVLKSDVTGKLTNEEPTQTKLTLGRQGKNSKKKRKPPENKKFQWGHIDRADVKWNWIWCCGLLMILVYGAAAYPEVGQELRDIHKGYDYRCSDEGSSRKDDVLDAIDVNNSLHERFFNGYGKNYTKVCSNAFHYLTLNAVNLTNNLLPDLPPDILYYTRGLKRVYLGRNKFTSFPLSGDMPDLELLDLSGNMISEIPKGTMNHMESLTTLNLTGNQNMTQVPEDVLILSHCCSLKSGIFTNTQIGHPLVPAPHFMLCTVDNPCNVTHEGSLIVVRPKKGNKVIFKITQDGATRCQELKQQIEADYNVENGSISCDNNGLGGSVVIVRKSKHDTVTDVTNQPDFTTGYAPTTECGKKSNLVIILLLVGIGIIAVVVGIVMKCKCSLCRSCQIAA
ncbi:Leucine-rich repeat, immunoglobulin-like domain and transmembrane domain-containing protein 3 [Holothuria leucospilota]|uniref:Leucine-rich repeat, immunoglobulin-like domain and transmembrane domain-containing protein 3 n=1 Tax=Holothuria leucospilota TaxID=206669 RepID=A0A9Q0YEI8_HOLLE|nr:Leucine-rich repeat, immunoglobulin-like domain and transmembrane domain-containing protein 3 [Holothuria leucospilota]